VSEVKTNPTVTKMSHNKNRNKNNMAYIINVAKSLGRNWNDTGETYHHYFRIETDLLDISAKATGTGKTLTDLVEEMQTTYPSPAYNVTLTKTVVTSHSVVIGLDNEAAQ
tara:strand:- start:207 stop:536 length:330 start_codon:yes stop_codon:yes gene_type:complete